MTSEQYCGSQSQRVFKKDIQCQMPQEEVKRGLRNLVWKLIACDFDVPLEGNM